MYYATINAEGIAREEQAAVDALVQEKIKEMAVAELKKAGKLTADGKVKK